MSGNGRFDSVDVAVVGAGSYGAATAFHLADRGLGVALLDRAGVATQTSARAAGLAVQVYDDEHLSRLSMRSIAKLRRFEQDTGESLTVHVTGSIKLARTDRDARQVQHELERGRALNVEIAPISAAEAHALAQWLEPWTATALWYAPDDLYLEPADLPRAYARAARRLGAHVLSSVEVLGLEPRSGGALLRTSEGDLEAGAVVLSAGAWTRPLIQAAGAEVPVVPHRHMLLVTAPLTEVRREDPCVRIIDAHAYVRPERGGLLFGAYEPEPFVPTREEVPRDMADLELDEQALRSVARGLRNEVPSLAGSRAAEVRGGLPTMTPDGSWIIDRLPLPGNLWVVTGCNVAGLGPSPAIGEDLATWIATGERPAPLTPFALDRFGALTESDLLKATRTAYVNRYREADRLVS